VVSKSSKPILKLGQKGFFDWAGIMPTDIITVNGVKYLYYIGWSLRQDVPYHNSLGLAISVDDGKTWEKTSKGPIFTTSIDEPGYVGTVEVLYEDDIWHMWYSSCQKWIENDGKMEPIYDIKYASSIDGITWKPSGQICIPLTEQEGGISSCRVIKYEDHYKMWYSVRDKLNYRDNPIHSYKIKSAKSKNGINWIKNNYPELDVSENEKWDSQMVCYPYVIDNQNELIMFYNGNNFGNTGIGYAIQTKVGG